MIEQHDLNDVTPLNATESPAAASGDQEAAARRARRRWLKAGLSVATPLILTLRSQSAWAGAPIKKRTAQASLSHASHGIHY